MTLLLEIIVGICAGLGAGVATGFAGLSAAAIIAPLLIGLLDVPFYTAVGIALASDVLASAAAAITYKKNGNLDMKKGRTMTICVWIFAVAGSVVAAFVTDFAIGNGAMSLWMVICSFLLGINMFVQANGKKKEKDGSRWRKYGDLIISIAGGVYIGFVCGFQGTGGGLMMLFVLNILLRIDFKKAVGTSVVIMTLTALIGSVSHFVLRGMPDIKLLIICIAATFVGAKVSAVWANRMKDSTLKRITGALLIASGAIMLLSKLNII